MHLDQGLASTSKKSLKSRLKEFSRVFKNEIKVYQLLLSHPDTPLVAKIFLGLAIGYLLMPFDLIPDFIPILGQVDDVIIVPGLVWLALKIVPSPLIEKCRVQ